MAGKKDDLTPIKDSVVFTGFDDGHEPIRNPDGTLTTYAKRRKLNFEQQLDGLSLPTRTPKEAIFNEEIADNYFKLGLVGMYVSNKKGEGFNDLGLHTLINTISKTNDRFNHPAKMLQALGRLRALDPTVVPFFFQAFGEKCTSTFDLKLLETTDEYYELYFKAEKKAHRLFLKHIAESVVNKIRFDLYSALDGEDLIDPVKLKWATLRHVAEALREVNNMNDHDIKLSTSELAIVLSDVEKEMNATINQQKDPNKMSGSFSVIMNAVSGFGILMIKLVNIATRFNVFRTYLEKLWELRKAYRDDTKDKDLIKTLEDEVLYLKILRMPFVDISSQAIALMEIGKTYETNNT